TRFSRDWSSDVCSSDLIAGELLVPDGERQPIRVQMEHLHLPAPTPGGTPGNALASMDPTTLPPVDLQIERVLLGDELLGKWSFRARPSGTGRGASELAMDLKGLQIAGDGGWTRTNGNAGSWFRGRVFGDDLRKVLQPWGFPPTATIVRFRLDLD